MHVKVTVKEVAEVVVQEDGQTGESLENVL